MAKSELFDNAHVAKYMGVTAGAVDAIGGIGSAITAGFLAEAARYTGETEEQRLKFNSDLLLMQADDVYDRADEAALDYMEGVGETVGAQRAGYAAQGVKVGGGVQAAVEAETRATARTNIARMRNRADLEASGIRTQASFQRMAGSQARAENDSQASAKAAGGALRGASQAAVGLYHAFNESGAFQGEVDKINWHATPKKAV